MTFGAFITGTGTGVGKTFLGRGIARALRRGGNHPIALKPIETGVNPEPLDAHALARACGRPELANAPGFYRAALPLAPYAVSLITNHPPPDRPRIVERVRECARSGDSLWVEGAGGLLVPLDASATMAELAQQLALPLLIVAQNQLGVLSHVLTCVECARHRELDVAAVVLISQPTRVGDASESHNGAILEERLGCAVLSFPLCADDDDELADAVEACALMSVMHNGNILGIGARDRPERRTI
jgi:dethiobiotin synthetase